MPNLRILLLSGLVIHKLWWELLKRASSTAPRLRTQNKRKLTPVKALKMAALGGLLVQTLALELFPISHRPRAIRSFGLILYMTGLATAILGRLHLGSNWVDLEDARVLPDQKVISNGVYRFIRHPIYAGDLLLVTGLQLALNSWLVLGAGLLSLVVARRAAAEEKLLAISLPDYAAYKRRTKRFIPFVF